ncbi:hypothetical protein KRR40_34730 [Niabella defluvii]|nr:hypothetical protein KRR40_34730 [Niabella sp. I65]
MDTHKSEFFGFWLFQIPVAYLLARHFELGATGVFIAIPVAETAITIVSFILFKRGGWKLKKYNRLYILPGRSSCQVFLLLIHQAVKCHGRLRE